MDKQLRKNMLWNSAGSITYLGVQWVITVLVTRWYGFEDAGVLSLAMSISSAFNTFALFGMRNYQISDINEKYPDSCYVMFRNISCSASLVLCAVFAVINNYNSQQISAILWFMLFRLSESYSDVLHGIAQKNGRLDICGKNFAIRGTLVFPAFVLSYLAGANLNISIISMTAAGWSVTIFLDLLIIRKLNNFKIVYAFKDCLILGKETLPLCIYVFLSSSITVVPKYMLEKMISGEILGIYNSILAPTFLLNELSRYIYVPFVRSFASKYNDKNYKEFVYLAIKILAAIIVLSITAIIAAKFLGEWVLGIVFGEQIVPYSNLLNLAIISMSGLAVLSFMCMLETVIRDFKALIIGCATGFVFTTVSSYFMIGALEADGASIGTIIGAFAGAVCMVCMVWFKIKKCKGEKYIGKG